jgi:hypothetical protein
MANPANNYMPLQLAPTLEGPANRNVPTSVAPAAAPAVVAAAAEAPAVGVAPVAVAGAGTNAPAAAAPAPPVVAPVTTAIPVTGVYGPFMKGVLETARELSGKMFSFGFGEDGKPKSRIGKESTFAFPNGQTFGDYIKTNGYSGATLLGDGLSGKTYLISVGGTLYALKHITNTVGVPLPSIFLELMFLGKVRGKRWAVQLLAAQIMEDGTAFLLFPYIAGEDLFSFLETANFSDATTVARLRRIYEFILSGIMELHSMGIIHRDIKPENIYIPSDPHLPPFLLDFGLANKPTSLLYPAGTRDFIRPERRSRILRHPAPNDNFYAFGLTAGRVPSFGAVATALTEDGLTGDKIKTNAKYHFRGGRSRRRSTRRAKRRTTRRH